MEPLANLAARPPITPHTVVAPHAPHAKARPPVAANDAPMGTVASEEKHPAQAAKAPAAKSAHRMEDAALSTLQTVQRIGSSVWTIGWVSIPGFPMPLPIPAIVGSVAGLMGMKSVKTAIDMAIHGTTQAIQDLPVNKLHHLPGQILKNASHIAAESQAVRAQNWATPIAKVADRMNSRMDKVAGGVGTVFAPVGKATGRAVDGFGESSVGKFVSRQLEGISQWRLARHQAKLTPHLEAVQAGFTQQPRGFKDWILRRPPVKIEMPAELHGVQTQVAAAMSKTGAERVKGLNAALQSVTELGRKTNLADGVSAHAQAIESKLIKAVRTSGKMQHLAEVAQGGVSTLLKNIAKNGGKTKLFTAAIGTALVAGAGVSILMAGRESRQAHEALQEMIADVGSADNAYIASVKAKNTRQNMGRPVSVAANIAAETMMLNGNDISAIAPAIAAQAGASAAGALLVGDNPTLNAYMTKKAAERGEIQLSVKDDLDVRKQLVAASSAVPKHEGIYNRMVTPVATYMQEKNMSAAEMVKTIADPARFSALLKAREAELKASTANDNEAGQVNANPDISPKANAEARYQQADKPATTQVLGGANSIHHGVLGAAQQQAQR